MQKPLTEEYEIKRIIAPNKLHRAISQLNIQQSLDGLQPSYSIMFSQRPDRENGDGGGPIVSSPADKIHVTVRLQKFD